MSRRTMYCPVLMAFAMAALPACMPELSIEDMKQMRPERPVELDKLKMFEGRWEGTGEVRMAGSDEVLKSKGSWEANWECDGWFLVDHEEYEMGELGKMKGMGIWTWDPKHNKYRLWFFDDWGTKARATATFDESTKTWTFKSKGSGPIGSSVGRGSAKMVDDDTMEWSWAEWPGWDVLRLFKMFEMEGTYKRQ